jgi:hypothetical protein
MVDRTMIVRVQGQPLTQRSDRLLRLQGFSLIALGTTTLAIWNPLTQPGPKVCLLRHAVGLPCPLCGMTRGLALCLRGRFEEASLFNPLAAPVLALAVLLAVKWAVEFTSGRRFDVIVPRWLARRLYQAVLLLLLGNWIFLMIYRREDPFVTTWLGQLWLMFRGEGR